MIIIDNDLKVKLKVIAVDGRIVERIISLESLIDMHVNEDDVINYISSFVCECCQNTESGFDPCSCADGFWETDSDNILIEVLK